MNKQFFIAAEFYNRNKLNPDYLYVFSDNAERNSGSNIILNVNNEALNFYNHKHYPNSTQACIRGCVNAYPITTKKSAHHNWTEKDIDVFKTYITNDVNRILDSNYEKIILPQSGFATGKASLPLELAFILMEILEKNFTPNFILVGQNGRFGVKPHVNEKAPLFISV